MPFLRPLFGAAFAALIVATAAATPVPRAQWVGPENGFAALDAQVRADMEASSIPGLAYAVTRDGAVLHVAGFGSGSDSRAITPQTPFVIGSVGKTMTALAIRQLVVAGRIDLDAPVQRYLPWFTLADPIAAGQVTVRMLLEHTSGLSLASGQDNAWYQPGLTPEVVVRRLATVAPDRPPGTSAEYSNLNFVILGVVVEAVSGRPYAQYLADNVFRPLAMTRSAATWDEAVAYGLVAGHRYLFGAPVPYVEPYPSAIVPAGYQVSTAEDMAHYVAAFANHGRYLGTDVVTGGSTGDAPDYGIDWQPLGAYDPGLAPGHSGATLNYNAGLIFLPAQRTGVVVLANANPTELLNIPRGAYEIALDVLRLSLGETPMPSPPTVGTAYLSVNLGLLLIVALTALHLARARTWRRRRATTRHPAWLAVRTAMEDGVVPLVILFGLPVLLGLTRTVPPFDPFASWRLLTWLLPDIASVLLGIAAILLAVGAVKVRWLIADRTARPPGR